MRPTVKLSITGHSDARRNDGFDHLIWGHAGDSLGQQRTLLGADLYPDPTASLTALDLKAELTITWLATKHGLNFF
jgi:hypothetical protein